MRIERAHLKKLIDNISYVKLAPVDGIIGIIRFGFTS
mgnify:CR=1 FL=1